MDNNRTINLLSDIIDDTITRAIEEENQQYFALIDNYERLIKENINILEKIIDIEISKSLLLYNYGTIIELFLKMILLKLNLIDIQKIADMDHNISEMFKLIIEKCNDQSLITSLRYIKSRMALLKYSNNNTINMNDYPHFRYNHQKGNYNLIFTENISNNDIKHIKEAIECIKSLMK